LFAGRWVVVETIEPDCFHNTPGLRVESAMPTEILDTSAPVQCEPSQRYRYRLRFAKTDDLRLVSHHDLMHVFERMMRRAEIPFAVTQGFHPQPKMSFALSLALGVIGRNEVFDLETTRDLDPDELIARLNHVAPAGLSFSSIARQDKKPSSQVRRVFYRLVLPNRVEVESLPPLPRCSGAEASPPVHDLSGRIATFLSLSEYWIIRTRPQRRRLNVRPFVCELSHDVTALSLILWVTPTGAARPEEIVHALGLGRLLDDGAVLERTHLELLGELPEHERFVPDLAACATAAPATETANDDASPDAETGRAKAHTALMDNPLSFDS
jgi:radical SAM-linked protein